MQLYEHQQRALKETEDFNSCAYYLDMGLGKTFVGAEKMHQLDSKVNLVVCQKSKIEDWVQLGIEGLQRVLQNNTFTDSNKVQKQIDEYEEENNPILAFIKNCDVETEILNEPTNEVYKRYTVFCAENSMVAMSNIIFSKQICKRLSLQSIQKKVNGKNCRVFVEI